MNVIPKNAIIDPNTFAVLGLKGILVNMIPNISVSTYSSFSELISDTYKISVFDLATACS